MQPGDFVITPYMAWHDHGNDTDEPMFWLDGLDIPLIQFARRLVRGAARRGRAADRQAGGRFARPLRRQPAARRPARRLVHLADLQLPLRPHARGAGASSPGPATSIPATASRCATPTPVTGDHAMPTMGTFIQLLPKGFKTSRYRSTDATVFAAVEGRGRTRVGEEVLDWGPQGHLRRAELEARRARGAGGRVRAVLLLRPPRAGKARPVPRGPRQCLRSRP